MTFLTVCPLRSVTRGRVLARALRLLFAQLKFLKLDAANAHLRMLARTMGRDQATECAPTQMQYPPCPNYAGQTLSGSDVTGSQA